jgi:hypothetical protein
VKKTVQVVGLFTKAARTLTHSTSGTDSVNALTQSGASIMKAIQNECEKDKAMSNLKGKIKEIQKIVNTV